MLEHCFHLLDCYKKKKKKRHQIPVVPPVILLYCNSESVHTAVVHLDFILTEWEWSVFGRAHGTLKAYRGKTIWGHAQYSNWQYWQIFLERRLKDTQNDFSLSRLMAWPYLGERVVNATPSKHLAGRAWHFIFLLSDLSQSAISSRYATFRWDLSKSDRKSWFIAPYAFL